MQERLGFRSGDGPSCKGVPDRRFRNARAPCQFCPPDAGITNALTGTGTRLPSLWRDGDPLNIFRSKKVCPANFLNRGESSLAYHPVDASIGVGTHAPGPPREDICRLVARDEATILL